MKLKRVTFNVLKPYAWRLLPFWRRRIVCENGCCADTEITFLFFFSVDMKERDLSAMFELVPRGEQAEETPHVNLH